MLPPVPGATHRLLTAKEPLGAFPCASPSPTQAFQALQSSALASVPPAVTPLQRPRLLGPLGTEGPVVITRLEAHLCPQVGVWDNRATLHARHCVPLSPSAL